MRKSAGATVLAGLMLISFVAEAMAHEWMATRLRGQVLQLVDGDVTLEITPRLRRGPG